MNYFRVMEFAQKRHKALSPFDLEWLRTVSYSQEPLLVREGQRYIVMNDAPYWTNQGMGIIFDPDKQEPSDFRGKFLIAGIRGVDINTGRTFPNYDKAIALGAGDLEKMLENKFTGFQIDEKTGLSIPIYGRKSKSFRRMLKEDPRNEYGTLTRIKGALLKPFAPIVGGFKAEGSTYAGNFYTADPRVKYPVWVHTIDNKHTP